MISISEMESKAKILKDWITDSQEHLPQNIDKVILMRYVHFCKGDVEHAKQLIDDGYTLRNKYPHIFIERDPTSEIAKKSFEDITFLPLASVGNCSIQLHKISDKMDVDKLNYNECMKAVFMIEDTRTKTELDHDGGVGDGEIHIFDSKGITTKHLMKIDMSTIRAVLKYIQDAYYIRTTQIHILNCSPMIEKIMFLVKSLIRNNTYDKIHFHEPNSNTLDKFIPRELLPNEYGGKAGTIDEIKAVWYKKVLEQKEYLQDDSCWKIDESKRKYTKDNKVVPESFKTISFD